MEKFDALFKPLRIGRLVLKNRIAMAPMGIDYMVNPDGSLNRRVVDYYLERIRNQVGLVICSVFKVENRIETLESCAPMINDSSMGYLGELCDAAHAFGARIFVQLTAGYGRVTVPSTLRGPCVSSSENANFWDPSLMCRELLSGEVEEIVVAMGKAAQRARAAGVDGIELHGHEGYLFDQFTSSMWNRRIDQYGGSLENRLRFPVQCLEEIRGQVDKDMVVQYRFGLKHYLKDARQGALPGEVFTEAGRDGPEGLEMTRMLEKAGFDSLHVDAGCYESHYWSHPPIYQKHGCMVDMGAMAKTAASVPIIGVGRLDDPRVANQAVADGKLDMVAVGRGFLADPEWAAKVRSGRVEAIRPCVACYDGCFGNYAKLRAISCAVNPSSGRERAYRLKPAPTVRNVMVVGGGIAGMEAARVAAIRGHRVSLYEKSAELGGLVRQAAVPSFKKDLRKLLAWYVRQLDDLGVGIKLKQEITAAVVAARSPDAVIVATGARPMVPGIPGVDRKIVATAVQILKGSVQPGDRVAIVGGGLSGCELAIWLSQMDREVILLELLPQLMAGGMHVPGQVKQMTLDLLAGCGARVLTACRVRQITAKGVLCDIETAGSEFIEVDTVVLAMGMTSDQDLADQLADSDSVVYQIGDCREPRNVLNAVWDAYEVARFI